jgi:hypothetical protein
MVHQQSKIFYRSGAGKQKDISDETLTILSGTNGSPAE